MTTNFTVSHTDGIADSEIHNQTAEHEFDYCSKSPTGKHSNSWYANGDCEHCKSGAQPDAPLYYANL